MNIYTDYIIDSIEMNKNEYDLIEDFEYNENELRKELDKLKFKDDVSFLIFLVYLSVGSFDDLEEYSIDDTFNSSNGLVFLDEIFDTEGIENSEDLINTFKSEYKKFIKFYEKHIVTFNDESDIKDTIVNDISISDKEIENAIGSEFAKYIDINEIIEELLDENLPDEIYGAENNGVSDYGLMYIPDTDIASGFYFYKLRGKK